MNWWNRLDTWEQTLLVAVLVVFVVYLFVELVAWVERNKPRVVRRDWVAERHCQIRRNGFKSRLGLR